jgi:hypothetical protein
LGVKVERLKISRVKYGFELRLADMDNQGGMAAILNISNLADFTVSATGKKKAQ